jgi:serine phosphatase RsbU (regulator of sigma subunit)
MPDHPRRLSLPPASSLLRRASVVRAWLTGTWVGRLLVSGFALKAVAYAGTLVSGAVAAALGPLDRVGNLALVAAGAFLLYRLPGVVRRRLLWRVRSRLVLSYIFIGVVPILLLITFVVVGVLLLFFNISSYLVQNRVDGLTDEASMLARSALVEIQHGTRADWGEILSDRRAVVAERYPKAALALVPTAGRPPCGVRDPATLATPGPASAARPVYAGPWTLGDPPDRLPRWVNCEGFAGVLAYAAQWPGSDGERVRLIARAVALPAGPSSTFAVIADLPVDEALAAALERDTGIRLGALMLIPGGSEAMPMRGGPEPAETGASGTAPDTGYPLNTVTFFNYTDWERGLTGSVTQAMSVRVPALYSWLSRAQGRIENLSFGQVLVYVLAVVGVLLLIVEIAALAMGLALARSITGSVHALFAGTQRVRQGDLTHRIAVRTQDQLGELADSFNEMTASISDFVREMAEKKRLEEELRIARNIQMSLLPHGPLVMPGLSVTALCLPAREVGGDYYDFLPLDDGRVGILIADVSGKGTSAALYMAELKGLVLSLSEIHSSPRQLLIDANRIIADHLDSRSFITMIYAVVDTKARTMTCARAGHTPFIYVPAADGAARQAQVLTPDGMVLGLKLDAGERFEQVLEEVTIPLATGDLFVFFTDGISEAMNDADEWFGEDRLSSLVEVHAALPSEELRERILREVESFVSGAPQHDDMTLIVMKVEGRPD